MAVFFRGLDGPETFALTDAMIRSGETIDLHAAIGRKVVDKHSTGGVGDKTSLAVGPIVAGCGVPFGEICGCGLRETGGGPHQHGSVGWLLLALTSLEFLPPGRVVPPAGS